MFLDKQKQSVFIAKRPALKKMLKISPSGRRDIIQGGILDLYKETKGVIYGKNKDKYERYSYFLIVIKEMDCLIGQQCMVEGTTSVEVECSPGCQKG